MMKYLLLLITLCSFTFSAFSQSNIIPTQGTTQTFNVSSGDVFYDAGGPGGCPATSGCANNYPNCNCMTTTTLCPSTPGDMVSVQFVQLAMWNTTSVWDWMIIYDNNGTSGTRIFDNGPGGPDVPYGDSGTDPMFTATATNPSGCLTFQFWATSVVDRLGWQANITTVGPLPMDIQELIGYSSGNTNVIQWKTGAVSDTYVYEIERSDDREIFRTVGTVQGLVNEGQDYTFTDYQPLNGEGYYRIRQTDSHGNTVFTNIIAINNESGNEFAIRSVAPNPVQDQGVIEMNMPEAGSVEVMITDMSGRMILQKTENLNAGVQQIELSLGEYEAGIYFLTLASGSERITRKLVKR